MLTPFALGTAIGAIASERVPVGNAAGDPLASWLNPTSLLIGVLAVVASAYVAAVFLAADADRQGERAMIAAFRRRALGAGGLAGAIALGGLFVLRADAPMLFAGLTEGAGLAAVGASAGAGVGTLALVAASRFEPARYTAGVAVAAIIAGWGIAQSPSFLPGLTVREAAASDATMVVLLVGLAAGALLLVPSLALLFRLVLAGRFDPGRADERADPDVRPRPRAPLGAPRGVAALAISGAIVLVVASASWLQGAGAVAMVAGTALAVPRLLLRAEAEERG